MLRVMTFNANGIRSAATKGFFEWFHTMDVDVLCVQELKAQLPDLEAIHAQMKGYQGFFHCAQKKGYSGCAVWTRLTPTGHQVGFGSEEFDAEGRYVSVDIGPWTIISSYFPSGSSSDERQAAKFRFLSQMQTHMDALYASGRPTLLCGDVNIAHQNIDLKNWKSNQNNSGFTQPERDWLTARFQSGQWVDVFRALYPNAQRYTWWSQRGQARAKDVGWRIDYQLATPLVAQCARHADIFSELKLSDHAPFWVDYDVDLMVNS